MLDSRREKREIVRCCKMWYSRLKVLSHSFRVSSTGAVRVQATVSASPMKIMGSVPGVADGYLVAEIRQGEKTVGSAKLRLPMYGLGTGEEQLAGICTDLQDPNAKYTIKLTYGKLWIIEQA